MTGPQGGMGRAFYAARETLGLTVSHGGEMSALALQEPTPDNATCAIECCVHIYVVHVL